MQQAVAKQFNIIPGICVPFKLLNNGFPLGTAILGGLFYTFSGKTEKDGTTSTCTRRKKGLVSEIGRSISTIRRSFISLKEKFILPVEGKENTYIFDKTKINDEQFIRIPYKLLNSEFVINYKEKKNRSAYSITRRLTQAEVIVGGLIITRCDNVNKSNSKKKFETSIAEIAETLGFSEPTVQSAIETLVGAKIIFWKQVGVNRYNKSIFCVHSKYLRKEKKEKKKAPKTQNSTQQVAEQVIVYKSAEDVQREQLAESARKEALIRHSIEDRQSYFYNFAMQDELFREAENELKTIGFDLAMAEARNLPTLSELRNRYEKFKRQRKQALERLKLTEKDIGTNIEDEGQAN